MSNAAEELKTARRRQLQLSVRAFCGLLMVSLTLLAGPWHATAQTKARHLALYSIDVEGGQSTLLVSPSGKTLLIDAGWAGKNNRDVDRIVAAMHEAGVTRIDYLFITHYHIDHIGGVAGLLKRVPVGEFIDHGPNRETTYTVPEDYANYVKTIAGHRRRSVHPGDTISIPGLSVVVIAADGEHISAVPGIRPEPNPYCEGERAWPVDPTEDARSAGILVTYGRFKFLDLGDLTGAKEVALVCPRNPIGAVDIYMADHHGNDIANARALVDVIHPRVAILNNGPHKGASPGAWQIVHDSPGLEGLWQLHTAEDSDAAHNSSNALIANTTGDGDGHDLKIVASPSGSFSVTNARTGQSSEYPHK